jgi:hypothetical protein
MTKSQIAARRTWRKAREKYRTATAGERTKARAAYEAAATAVLRADRASRDVRKAAA